MKSRGRSSVRPGLPGAFIPPAAAACRLSDQNMPPPRPLFPFRYRAPFIFYYFNFQTGSNWPVALSLIYRLWLGAPIRSESTAARPHRPALASRHPAPVELQRPGRWDSLPGSKDSAIGAYFINDPPLRRSQHPSCPGLDPVRMFSDREGELSFSWVGPTDSSCQIYELKLNIVLPKGLIFVSFWLINVFCLNNLVF